MQVQQPQPETNTTFRCIQGTQITIVQRIHSTHDRSYKESEHRRQNELQLPHTARSQAEISRSPGCKDTEIATGNQAGSHRRALCDLQTTRTCVRRTERPRSQIQKGGPASTQSDHRPTYIYSFLCLSRPSKSAELATPGRWKRRLARKGFKGFQSEPDAKTEGPHGPRDGNGQH